MAFFFSHSSFSYSANPKVVVVGGGLGGLTTAYRLNQKGIDVDLYEAKDRVGGRVLSVKVGEVIGELGGMSLLDGGESTHILNLISECGLELNATSISMRRNYYSNEEIISEEKLWENTPFDPEELRAKLEVLSKRAQNMEQVLESFFDKEDPRYRILALRLTAYEGGQLKFLSPQYVETLYHIMLGGLSAAHPYTREKDEIKRVSIKGGNSLLAEKMGESLQKKPHLSSPLKKVMRNKKGKLTLQFNDHDFVEADILVLAIPCSVYADIDFDEEIIAQKRLESIQQVQYGTSAKILLPAPDISPSCKGISNDRAVCYSDEKLLTLYYAGLAGIFSSETIDEHYNKDLSMLQAQFGTVIAHCPHAQYAKDQPFIHYSGPVGYCWSQDPYIKGCYSYVAAGQETVLGATCQEEGEWVRTLFAPINQTIYFAGEHASTLVEGAGTMEAACESGEKAARMILKTCAF